MYHQVAFCSTQSHPEKEAAKTIRLTDHVPNHVSTRFRIIFVSLFKKSKEKTFSLISLVSIVSTNLIPKLGTAMQPASHAHTESVEISANDNSPSRLIIIIWLIWIKDNIQIASEVIDRVVKSQISSSRIRRILSVNQSNE